jgi:hypothetical protein
MSITRIIVAVLVLTILGLFVLAGTASAAVLPHHPWYCTARDYGNIRTEPSGKSYICQPDGRRYTWQIIRARIEN